MQRVGASLLVTLVADRFLRHHDRWIDISTAEPVTLAVHAAGSLREQIGWAEHCSMLSRLRHPLLNPLIDYGAADATSFFEAYAVQDRVAATGAAASRFTAHADRFLEAHGVAIAEEARALVYRRIRQTATGVRGRPVGFVLQPRRACDAVTELLSASSRGGVTTATVTGAAGSGLRTCVLAIAQAARIEGYVPVCPAAIQRWPDLLNDLSGRHVCLIVHSGATPAERGVVATLLARLARRSARPHVMMIVNRAERPACGALRLEPMGITSMTSMLYVDRECGPSPDDVFEAARQSDGLPARFLARLGARSLETATRVFTVHESPVAYGSSSSAGLRVPIGPKRSRIGSVLWRASGRAADLEARGRHAAAGRLLARAARALEGRGDAAEAAQCWRQLAWMARSRGAMPRALEYAERAGQTDLTPEGQTRAALVIAVCWTDDARFIEAEASLRSLVAGAAAMGAAALQSQCVLALARVLCWSGKGHESLAVIDSLTLADDRSVACEAFIRRAKAYVRSKDARSAIQAAREASRLASEHRNRRLQVAAHLATADALCAAGDVDGVRLQVTAGIGAASEAHLPLAALRLRATLLQAVRASKDGSADASRLLASLQRALRHPLPVVVRRLLVAACNESGSSDTTSTLFGSRPPSARLEDFLEIAQAASDDATAVGEVLRALCERISAASVALVAASDSRVLATAGRPWRDKPTAAIRAATAGQSVPADASSPPLDAGEPVRCGGALVGAIGCRWLVGDVVSSELVWPIMRAASLSIATHVRALVETLPIESPPGVWNDLIGESSMAVALRESALRASRAPFPVLIEGESGSGKELVARAIHKLSSRHTRRFCAINCAALSDELVEAELFGHTRGAFTGATTERAGLFEEADGGTLFLDEVGELSARAQAKLLRVVQEGEVRRIGENLPRRVDVRIVAATNRRLEDEAAQGRFRTDLRFRLDVLRIVVPPLRERIADIPLLAQHFWRQATARVGSQATLGSETLAALSRYDWPGNVRELQNAIAWLSVHAPRRGRVSAGMLPAQLASSPMATGSFEAAREDFERRYVRAALAQAGGQRHVAAKALGMSRQGLAKMLRRLGIDSG